MSAPVAADLVIYGGADGTPTNITDPYGGAIDTGAPLDGTVVNVDLATIYLADIDTDFYAGVYVKNNCSTPGTLSAARIYNRNGARVNASAGVMQYASTSAADVGNKIVITGKIAGTFTQETVTLTGSTPVTGALSWDVGSVLRHEVLSSVDVPAKPVGNITGSCAGQILTVVYGTASNPPGRDLSVLGTSAEFMMALCASKGVTLNGSNRLTAPSTSMGSFGYATYWAGDDNALAVPGAELAFGEYIGVAIKFTAYAGIQTPVSNQVFHFPVILGTPQ